MKQKFAFRCFFATFKESAWKECKVFDQPKTFFNWKIVHWDSDGKLLAGVFLKTLTLKMENNTHKMISALSRSKSHPLTFTSEKNFNGSFCFSTPGKTRFRYWEEFFPWGKSNFLSENLFSQWIFNFGTVEEDLWTVKSIFSFHPKSLTATDFFSFAAIRENFAGQKVFCQNTLEDIGEIVFNGVLGQNVSNNVKTFWEVKRNF